jgi:hypothetical protein
VEFDQNAFNKEFTKKYHCNETTDPGYLFWDCHPAQSLLKTYIENKGKDVERGIIYIACTQYQEFPREVFSNHYFCED